MFYCEDCQKKNDWPTNIRGYPTSHGRCEVCEKTAACYDVPSSCLPVTPLPPKK